MAKPGSDRAVEDAVATPSLWADKAADWTIALCSCKSSYQVQRMCGLPSNNYSFYEVTNHFSWTKEGPLELV